MNQWDFFIENEQIEDKATFKVMGPQSYERFREVMQILDIAILDIETLQHQPRVLVISVLYLVLALYYKVMSVKDIKMYGLGDYLKNNAFNKQFGVFLERHLSWEIEDMLPGIQYLSQFFVLPFSYVLPVKCKQDHKNTAEYEEFLQLQTMNQKQLIFLLELWKKLV